MSNSVQNNEKTLSPITLSIAARIELGRETQSHSNGGIIPFPEGYRATNILKRLTGKERAKVDQWLGWKYQATVFEYFSAAGEVIQMVLRFDRADYPKEIRPLRYLGLDKLGRPQFWMSAIDGQRPLYGLHDLANRPDASVLVIEGEKTAEAAKLLFPDYVPITWMGGAPGVTRTEMGPLADKFLTIWPDNDETGRKAGRLFASLAFKAGAARISVVDIPREFPEKWDLADPAPEVAL